MAFLHSNNKNRSNVKNSPVFDTQHYLRANSASILFNRFIVFLQFSEHKDKHKCLARQLLTAVFAALTCTLVPWYKSMILIFLISVVKYIILYFFFRKDTKYRCLLKTEICLPSLWKNPVKVNCRCEDKLKNNGKKHKLNWDALGTTASDKYLETVSW